MKNFEKCNVAILGGPCSQHVMGNTSRQIQPQSAIMGYTFLVSSNLVCNVGERLSPFSPWQQRLWEIWPNIGVCQKRHNNYLSNLQIYCRHVFEW